MSQHVRVGVRDIAVTEFGVGPAVVLLHGGGPGTSGMPSYARNIDTLAERFRVIVVDLPGYGRSTKRVDHRDPFGDLASTIGGLLDELGVASAHLVGHSYGGAAALRLALDQADRVERMVLVAPGGIGTTRAMPTAGVQRLLGYYRGSGPSKAKLEDFIRNYLVFDGTAITADMIEERYRASLDPEVIANPPLRRPSGRGALRTLIRLDLTRDKRLLTLTTPTLVVWGSDDRINRPSGAQMLAARIPTCDLFLAANTGHWVHWERADTFNALTIAFLSA